MSEQAAPTRTCPTCGNQIPAMARYCPNCGTRLDPTAVYSANEFEDALADVLDAPRDETPSESPPPVSPIDTQAAQVAPLAIPTGDQAEWTARASDWAEPSAQEGTWTAQPPVVSAAKPRGNRTLWIILAIVGFIIFCCCGGFFALLLVAERDTAFQQEISHLAMLWVSHRL